MLPEGCELNLSTEPDNVTDLRSDPLFYKAGGFIFEQLSGEIVFVPSGWYHQVHNEVIFFSIFTVNNLFLGFYYFNKSQLVEFI